MWTIYLFILCLTLAGCGSHAAPAQSAAQPTQVHAGGLVEPAGEERVLIPQVSGRLAHVYVEEGDRVKTGQVLAEIENAEYQAAIGSAQAQIQQRQAELDRLRHGARPEEIRAGAAALDEARAQTRVAEAELKRRDSMVEHKLVSREERDQAAATAEVARAREAAAAAQLDLLRAGARSEDITAAESALAQARSALTQAQALYAKTQIRAPLDGVVLKRDLSEGETVVALAPIPLARIGDMSHMFVRAEIDELDIARVKVGQRAQVSADAFPGQRFAGAVVRVAQRMGKRAATSDDPAQKQDVKVLEALVALEGQPPLPVGLRVDVTFETQ